MTRYVIFLILMCSTLQAFAETVFVQDVIYVPIRGGASEEYRIIHNGLPSGTRLELLKEDKESGFSLVRLKDGTEGWIKSQYISTEPIARDKLKDLTARLATSQKDKALLQSSIDQLTAVATQFEAEKNALTVQAQGLQTDLDNLTSLSSDTIRINDENTQLQSRNKLLMEELDSLNQMNSHLVDTRNQRWFLLGAATLFLGIIPGFWFARKIYNRRSTGWTD